MSAPFKSPSKPNRWHPQLYRSRDGVPVLAPEIVSELGRDVMIVDLRERTQMSGPLGHVSGAILVPFDNFRAALGRLPADTRLVLVSGRGQRSAEAVIELERAGMTRVASMLGGMEEWRARGIGVSRREDTYRLTVPDSEADAETADASGQRLEVDDIVAHIGDPVALRWTKMAAFLLQSRISCIDGRDSQGVVGTPGGDAGEFLLALAAIESLTEIEFGIETVADLLDDYIETFGRFYMHTDRHAVGHWILAMRADPQIAAALPDSAADSDEWARWFRSPPVQVRERLLGLLVEPGNIGCGHLRLMTEHPAAYGLRRQLVVAFLRAYFRRIWTGASGLECVVLEGAHAEQAVVNIVLEGEIWPFTRVPLIPPAGAIQIFVNHPQVVTYLRRQVAGFFSIHSEIGIEEGHDAQIAERMAELGAQQLGQTICHLAKGLPIFEARFLVDGSVFVTEVG